MLLQRLWTWVKTAPSTSRLPNLIRYKSAGDRNNFERKCKSFFKTVGELVEYMIEQEYDNCDDEQYMNKVRELAFEEQPADAGRGKRGSR